MIQKWLRINNYDGMEMSLVTEIRDIYTTLAVQNNRKVAGRNTSYGRQITLREL